MNGIAAIVIVALLAATAITFTAGQNATTATGNNNSTLDAGLDAPPAANETKATTGADLVSKGNASSPNATDSSAKVPPAQPPTAPEASKSVPAVPAPSVYSYSLPSTTATDKFCIIVSSALQFTVVYPTENNTVATTTFNAGSNGTLAERSSCGNESFPPQMVINYTAFQVYYTFDDVAAGDGKYSLAHLSLSFSYGDSDLFPGSNTSDPQYHGLSADTNQTYVVPKDRSYRCDVDKSIELTGVGGLNGTATISSFKFAAFGQFDKDAFGEAEECSDDFTTSDIVPIAVGCALAALVVIVLIAYLIGRRRSRQKGYQSV